MEGLAALIARACKDSSSDSASDTFSLPLLGCSVKAEVLGCISQVTVNQCFQNTRTESMDITYSFPLNEGSTVCDFRYERENGTVIDGVVKEKQKAIQEFKEAKMQGRTAALLKRDRPDIFMLSLGHLGPKEHAKVSITYLSILNSEGDDLCFIFPTSLAPLYTPENSSVQADGSSSSPIIFLGYELEASFTACSAITSLSSPSHGDEKNISINLSGTTAAVQMTGITKRSDIILICKEEKAREPRALLEVAPDGGLVGLVMFSPRIEWTEPQPQEFFFIVDRSGSMEGIQMEQVYF